MKIIASRKCFAWLSAFAAALVIGAAVAAGPGPTNPGQYFFYLDANGKLIGYRGIDCNGNPVTSGKTSSRYYEAYRICEPLAN
jgi:hypothetical protein